MKKILMILIVGVSMMYGGQITHNDTVAGAQQSELEQVRKEIQQLKLEEADLKVLKQNTVNNYAIEADIDEFLNEFYNT